MNIRSKIYDRLMSARLHVSEQHIDMAEWFVKRSVDLGNDVATSIDYIFDNLKEAHEQVDRSGDGKHENS